MNILITGAASGIGAAIATLAAKKGHTVGIYDIDLSGAHELVKRLNGKYAKITKTKEGAKRKLFAKNPKDIQPIASAGRLDVSNEADWDAAIADFVAFAGGIDVLVNNAGIVASGKFAQVELGSHLKQVEVNAKGVLLGCYKAKPHLPKHANAKVINLSSASAIYGQPDLVTYSASKFFVRGLTEGLDAEWAADGIRVMDMMPLFVATRMTDVLDTGSIDKMGINLTTEDVAKTVLKALEKPNKKWQPTHHQVGFKAKMLYELGRHAPARINQLVHKNMAKQGDTEQEKTF